jgi:hypothetical protein
MTTSVEGIDRLAFEAACRKFAGTLANQDLDPSAPLRQDLVEASPQWQRLVEGPGFTGTGLTSALVGVAEAARIHPSFAGQLVSALVLAQALGDRGASCVGRVTAATTAMLTPDGAASAGELRPRADDPETVLSGLVSAICPPTSNEVVALVQHDGGGLAVSAAGEGRPDGRDWGWTGTLAKAVSGPPNVLAELDERSMTRVYDVARAGAAAALAGLVDAEASYALTALAEQSAASGRRWAAQAAEHRLVDAAIDGDSALLAALDAADASSDAERTRLSAVAALCGLEAFGLVTIEARRMGQLAGDTAFVSYNRSGESLAEAIGLIVGGPLRLNDLIGDTLLGR